MGEFLQTTKSIHGFATKLRNNGRIWRNTWDTWDNPNPFLFYYIKKRREKYSGITKVSKVSCNTRAPVLKKPRKIHG